MPGLNDIVTEIFKDSEFEARYANQTTHFPFIDIDEVLGKYSDLLPFLPQKKNVNKSFMIKLQVSK
jgi:hypothetical protein